MAHDATVGALQARRDAHSEQLRRLLFEAGVCVAAANGEIEKSEIEALRTLLGATAMLGEIDPAAIRGAIDERLARVRESSPLAERAQLVQHLTIVAGADGQVGDAADRTFQR